MKPTAALLDRRLAQVRARVAEQGLEGLLVRHLPNIRYLTGFSGSNGWLWLSAERAILCTDGRYRTQAEQEVPAGAGIELFVARQKLLKRLLERVIGERVSRAAFEELHVRYAEWRRLAEHAPAVEWSPAAGWVEASRSIKDPDERDAIGRAAELAERALQEALSTIGPGIREMELAAELDYRMVRLGSEGAAFETIVASGSRSALPHARSGDRELAPGDLLLIDFGARRVGYCSDLTRTFVLGEPTSRQKEMYARVHAAREAALAVLGAGVAGSAVDRAAREVFEAAGLGERFSHSTGHGLGLEVHEAPRLNQEEEDPLPAGAVVTVEPGLYFPDWGGIRLEDDFLVIEQGVQPLSGPVAGELPSIGL